MRNFLLSAAVALLPLMAASQSPTQPQGEGSMPASQASPAQVQAAAPLSIERALARRPSDDPIERLGITWGVALQRQPVELLIAALLAAGVATAIWQLAMFRRHLKSTQEALEVSRTAAQAARASSEASRLSADVMLKAHQPVIAVADVVHGTFSLPAADAGGGARSAFQIRWKNFGRTPALDCRLSTMGHVLPRGEPLPSFEPLRNAPTATTLAADAVASAPACVFSPDIVDAWLRKESRLVIQARCTYATVFAPGAPHIEEACFELIGTGQDADQRPRFHWVTVDRSSNDPDREMRT